MSCVAHLDGSHAAKSNEYHAHYFVDTATQCGMLSKLAHMLLFDGTVVNQVAVVGFRVDV